MKKCKQPDNLWPLQDAASVLIKLMPDKFQTMVLLPDDDQLRDDHHR